MLEVARVRDLVIAESIGRHLVLLDDQLTRRRREAETAIWPTLGGEHHHR